MFTYSFNDLGQLIRQHVAALLNAGEVDQPGRVLYAEYPGGFNCRTCRYATPSNATHGRCRVLPNTVSLDNGCCAAWDYAERLLQVKEATTEP